MEKYCVLQVLAVLVGSAVFAVSGCQSQSKTVTIILAQGLRGLIVIDSTSNGGASGSITIRVPADGIVKVDGNPFEKWHTQIVKYEDGTLVESLHNAVTNDKVGFEVLFSRSDGTIWCFVGTRDEKDALFQDHKEWRLGSYTDPYPH